MGASERTYGIIQSDRLDFVDLLKVIAIFFVLIFHSFSDMYSYDYANIVKFSYTITYVNYFLISIFGTSVPLFFFVNGGLLLNKKDFNLNKHTYKIIKLVFLTTLWAMITLISLSFIRGETVSFKNIIYNSFNLKHHWNHHLWFLKTLVVIYIFYPLLFNSFQSSKRIFYFFSVAVFLFSFGNTFIGQLLNMLSIVSGKFQAVPFEHINYFSKYNTFRGIRGYSIGYFILGGILFNYRKFLKSISFKLLSILLLVSMFCITLYGILVSNHNHKIWDIVWNGLDSIFTVINLIILFVFSLHYKNKGVLGKIVKVISENTLGIYLIHWIIQEMIKPFVFTSSGWKVIILAIGTICISTFIALIMKKIPLFRFILSL